jgi:hypothetical protein
MCFDFATICVNYFSLKNLGLISPNMFTDLHVKNRYCREILIKVEVSRRFPAKKNKFHENLSSGSRVVVYGLTDRHDEAYRNLAKVPKTCKLNVNFASCCVN